MYRGWNCRQVNNDDVGRGKNTRCASREKICSSPDDQRRQPAWNFKGERRLSETRRLLTGGKLRDEGGKMDLYINVGCPTIRDKPVISANENLSFGSL